MRQTSDLSVKAQPRFTLGLSHFKLALLVFADIVHTNLLAERREDLVFGVIDD